MARHEPRTSQTRDATVDPVPSSRRPESAANVAFAEVVFHGDLRMVGARALLSARESSQARALVIGRDTPDFAHDDGSSGGPLADPCISRRQLELRWSATNESFCLEREPGARRELRVFDADGAEMDASVTAVPPGTLIALGDRMMLRVDCGPVPSSSLGLLGSSAAVDDLRRTTRALARTGDAVLIVGETGTGKELVARALHDAGPRRQAPFVPVSCGAIPDALVEAELFGFVRGAFTGASDARGGLFRAAGSGTLFLDEIGELPMAAQAKLLRALQERRVRPLGSTDEIAFAARVVMATHRDLEEQVAQGKFREDLFARIEAPRIALPPLRERREDVPRLFAHFLSMHLADVQGTDRTPFRAADAQPPLIPMSAFLRLIGHDWPRNVREVQKLAAQVAADLRVRGVVDEAAFPRTPDRTRERERERPELARRDAPKADELIKLLDENDFVQSRLARALGISRTTLDKWMREAGVRRPRDVGKTEIVEALERTAGDAARAARELRISTRGLRLRATELGIGS